MSLNKYVTDYINNIEDYLKKDDKNLLIEANLKGKKLMEEDLLSKDVIQMSMNEDLDCYNKNGFNWELVKYMQVKHNLIKKFKNLIDINRYLWEYIDYHIIHYILKVDVVKAYLSIEFHECSNKHYDKVLRLQTSLIQVFSFFYIEIPTFNLNKISTNSISLIDPFSRIMIRNHNINNKYLLFLLNDFNIKKFVYKLLDVYFPHFSWRFIGSDMGAFKEVFNIIFILLELGLYKQQDIKILINNINIKIDIIKNLENCCQKDFSTFQSKFKAELEVLFPKTKEIITGIILQIIILYNDCSFIEDFGKLKENLMKVNKKNYLNLFKNYIFLNESIYIVINFLVLNFCFSKKEFTKEQLNLNLSRYLNQVFLLMIDYKYDCFYLSFKIIDKNFMNFAKNLSIDDNSIKFNQELDCFIDNLKYEKLDNKIFVEKLEYITKNLKDYKLKKSFIYSININNGLMKILSIISFINSVDIKIYYKYVFEIMFELEFYFNNKQCQEILVKNEGVNYFNVLLKNLKNETIFMLIRNFINNLDFILNDHDNTILKYIMSNYEDLLSEFHVKIINKDYENIDKNDILEIFLFNKLFDILLKKNHKISSKKSNIDLLIQNIINPFIINILELFYKKNLFNKENSEFFEPIIFKLKKPSFQDYKNVVNISDKNLLIYEVFYSILKIYLKSCRSYYLEETYKLMSNKINILEESLYFFDIKYGIRLRILVLEIYNSFEIFFNNHLFNNRIQNNKGNRNNIEKSIPDNMLKLEFELLILNEIEHLKNYYNKFISSNDKDILYYCKKYFFTVFFPMIYKYCSGIMKLIDPDSENFSNFIKKVKSIIKSIQSNLNFFNKFFLVLGIPEKKMKNFIEQFNEIFYLKKIIDKRNNKIFKNIISKVNKNINTFKDNEEILYPKLYNFRISIKKLLSTISLLYKDTSFENFISDFKIEDDNQFDDLNINKYEDKYELNKKLLHLKKKTKFKITYNDYDSLLNYMLYYRNMKKYLIIYKSQNIFLNILKKEFNKNSNSIQNIFKFFISYFNNINYDLKGDIYESFNINPFYYTLINIINILLKWKNQVKDIFLAYLNDKNISNQVNTFFNNLWYIYRECLFFISYKPFRDEIWIKKYKDFLLITDFIQNCCENGYIGFKKYFYDFTLENKKKLVFEYYVLLENLSFFTKCITNKEEYLVISDKKNIFLILSRMFYCLNEFVNGPCKVNQELLYRYCINNWANIVLRDINNINSNFYDLKLKVIYYLSSLGEGNNFTTNNFLSSNLDPNEIFELINSLIKKLFVYQIKLNEKNIKKEEACIINKKEQSEYTINSPKELIEYYINYKESFSNHIIIQISIELFKLIYHISKFSRIFINYIRNKEKSLEDFKYQLRVSRNHDYLEYNTGDEQKFNLDYWNKHRKPSEDLIIFKFLKILISEIEIVDDNGDLKNLFFPLTPQTFFLTGSIKDKFLNEIYFIEDKRSFITNDNSLRLEMEKNYKIYQKSHLLYYISNENFSFIIQIILMIISIAANLIFLIYYDKSFEENPNSISIIILYLNLSWVILSGIYIIFYLALKFKYAIKIQKKKTKFHKTKNKLKTFWNNILIYVILPIINSQDFVTFILHFIFGLFGLFRIYIIMSFNLYIFIFYFRTLKTIINSIIQYLEQIFLSLLWAFILIYSLSIITIEYFRNEFDLQTVVCENLVMCYLNVISLGLRVGLNEYFIIKEYSDNLYGFRFVYDLIFFFTINLVFINIIAGIIIDTFANNRDKLRDIQQYKNNTCTVCNLDRAGLEKNKISFKDHILKYHHPIKYVFFLNYLNEKNSEDYSGDEVNIKILIDDNKNNWIPNKKTHFITKNQQNTELMYEKIMKLIDKIN